jgi:hypothetical protein
MTTCSEQKIKEQPNKALHWTEIPLRSIPASEEEMGLGMSIGLL